MPRRDRGPEASRHFGLCALVCALPVVRQIIVCILIDFVAFLLLWSVAVHVETVSLTHQCSLPRFSGMRFGAFLSVFAASQLSGRCECFVSFGRRTADVIREGWRGTEKCVMSEMLRKRLTGCTSAAMLIVDVSLRAEYVRLSEFRVDSTRSESFSSDPLTDDILLCHSTVDLSRVTPNGQAIAVLVCGLQICSILASESKHTFESAMKMESQVSVYMETGGEGSVDAVFNGNDLSDDWLDEWVRERTDVLDLARNTTTAVDLALFGAFCVDTDIRNVDVLRPWVFTGLLVGAVMPCAFAAMTMKLVEKATNDMVQECMMQYPLIIDGSKEPDHERCTVELVGSVASFKDVTVSSVEAYMGALIQEPVLVANGADSVFFRLYSGDVMTSWCSMFGVAPGALDMLDALTRAWTIDACDPISDNVGGVAEMAQLDEWISHWSLGIITCFIWVDSYNLMLKPEECNTSAKKRQLPLESGDAMFGSIT